MREDTFGGMQISFVQALSQISSLFKPAAPSTDLAKEYDGNFGKCKNCAYLGLAIGMINLVSWTVVLLGIIISIVGIVFSAAGLKSERAKHARIGLILSIIGFVASFGYVFAAHQGMINYDYFTTEFVGNMED